MSETGFQSSPGQESFTSELLSIGQGIDAMLDHAASAFTHPNMDRAAAAEAALAGQVIGIEIERLQRGLPEMAGDLSAEQAEQALHQLQRLNEEAAGIGRIARRLQGNACQQPLLDLAGMAGCVRYMLGASLEALVTQDTELVEMVALTHEQAAAFARQLRERLQSCSVPDQEAVDWMAAMLSVVGHLERIAGYAVSIAGLACRKEPQPCACDRL